VRNRTIQAASLIIIGLGLILLVLNSILGSSYNIALPLLFLILGGGFFILVYAITPKLHWGPTLYIPGMLFIVFGVIFLLNILTKDWNSWAFSWLLLIAAIGTGIILANRSNLWPVFLNQVGWGMVITGISLFVIFGAIAGGLFIQVMAPILFIAAGISIRYLHLEKILPDSVLKKLHINGEGRADENSLMQNGELVKQLSDREVEVLQLIRSGMTNQQIASSLSVAPSTIKTHINNIYGKLGVQTRVQALNRSRELGILKD
jgi:DNA-binding CsgD family transcriptional regulator